MKKRLMGCETEYTFTVLDPHGTHLDREALVKRLMQAARTRLRHLRGHGAHDLYLQTGARFYVDCGLHPEWATPEVTNPWDAVRYLKAGSHVLTGLIAGLESGRDIGEVVMGRCNVSYGSDSTCGRHESYSYQGDFETLARQLIPFLVSRVIYHGAGGFTQSPGIGFTLSPRCLHIVRDVSGESTTNRAIFHTKQESLNNGGYGRVHVLCGDSLCSDLGNWVTIGATALVIAAIESGLAPGTDVQLRSPVEALHHFAGDPTCRTEQAALSNGQTMTALDIQRHYCRCVGAHLQASSMPDWAGEVHAGWHELLGKLEQAPESVTSALDAPMKLAVFKNHARRRSFDWGQIADWNLAVNALHQVRARVDRASEPLTAAAVLDPKSPLAGQVGAMKWFMQRRGLSWDRLDAFLDLRAELQEIDTRWTQLGAKGIFSRIEATCPTLDHRVPGLDRIEDATRYPPGDTRAAARGAAVTEFSNKAQGAFGCSWEYVWDHEQRRILNMADDPFTATAQWKSATEDQELSRLFDLPIEDELVRYHFERQRHLRDIRRRQAAGEPATLLF